MFAWAGQAAGADAGAGGDETGRWRDIESRIQYAYYTEDAAALRALGGELAGDDTPDAMRSYYGALLAWRQALLAATGAGGTQAASPYAGGCVSAADAALERQPGFADAQALRGACLALPPGAAGLSALTARRARRDVEQAGQLAPRNPRVLLVTALVAEAGGGAEGPAADRALETARRAVAAFEAERSGVGLVPGWGAAESWLLLGRELLARGDAVGARDALEHALLIAPDYAAARRLMARLTAG